MREELNEMLQEIEGNYVEMSWVGAMEDEVCVNELHTDIIKYSNGRDYIVTEDIIDDEQHIPRIAVDTITDVKRDLGEWIIKTNCGIDVIYSIN